MTEESTQVQTIDARGSGSSVGRRTGTTHIGGWKWRLLPYALVLPALVFELIVHIVPMLVGVWMSFLRLTQLTIRNWTSAPGAGLNNYRSGLDPSGPIGAAFYSSVIRTVVYTAIVVGLSWALGMFAAVLVNGRFRGRAFFRTLFMVPFALPVFVVVIGWKFIFGQRDGALNHALVDNLGLLDNGPFWLIGDNSFWAMVATSIWRTWPFAFLMLLAALQSISDDMYEAARLDGASTWQQFRNITLPSVRPANVVLVLVLTLWTFNEFATPFVLFGPAPPDESRLIGPHVYVNSFVNFNFGLGAAMSTLLLLLMLVASGIYLRLVLRKGEQHA